MADTLEIKNADPREYTIHTSHLISGFPKPVWYWDMFGGRQMVVTISDACPEPSWWQRFMTRLLFGSKWKRAD